jgi:putative transposase
VLANIAHSTVYAPHLAAEPDERELVLLAKIDAEYTRHPFYGSRKMVVHLHGIGYTVNRKHVQRLMRILGLAGWHLGRTPASHTCQGKIWIGPFGT